MEKRQIVFQAWMWKLNEIPVEEIAKQGYTAIQTSPLQLTKELKGKVEILDNCIMVIKNIKRSDNFVYKD